jgi:hypothetical protein
MKKIKIRQVFKKACYQSRLWWLTWEVEYNGKSYEFFWNDRKCFHDNITWEWNDFLDEELEIIKNALVMKIQKLKLYTL